MKCSICGGKLVFNKNIYECQSCGNKVSLISAFDKTEVYLAYIENDEVGRRTRDSIIAQEIYNKLQGANINTFYERLSCGTIVGEDLENAKNYAWSAANVVVLIGTNVQNFNLLMDTLNLQSKKVLPVYAELDADKIPPSLKELQALNYNSLGAISDLLKVIYHELHRDDEYNYSVETNSQHQKRRKKNIGIIISSVAILLICSFFFVFCTPYILPSKKYDAAENLLNKGKYIEALDLYYELEDYRDCESKIKNIYSRYIGYYFNEDSNISLHINIIDNVNAELEIKQISELGTLTILESCQIVKNNMVFSFNDSENNQGEVSIELLDENINLNVKTTQTMSELTFGNLSCDFEVNEKTDKPFAKEITKDIIKEWLNKSHTKNDLVVQGYELTFLDGDKNTSWESYKIANTNVVIDFIGRELSYTFIDSEMFDEGVAFAFTIPAEIVVPHKLGEKCEPFAEGNIMYIPSYGFSCYGQIGMDFGQIVDDTKINKDTLILCLSQDIVSKEFWDEFMRNDVYSYFLEREYRNIFGGSGKEYFKFCGENDTHYLATTSTNFNQPTTPMFKIDKRTYKVEFIGEIPYDSQNYEKIIDIYSYPEYFSEFYNI